MAAKPASDFGRWEAAGLPVTIHYSFGVLDDIRREVVDGFRALPRGGIEVGGVLFGACEGDAIWIRAARPLQCEHALGPGFVLSNEDEAALRELMLAPQKDPALAGMVVLGWYHSHTRSEIFLTGPDLDLHERYFPEPWQVALVLRPDKMNPTRAGFFARAADGSIRAESSHREFELPQAAPFRLAAPEASRRPRPVPVIDETEQPAPMPRIIPEPVAPVRLTDEQPPRRFRPGAWIVAALVIAVAAFGVFVAFQRGQAAAAPPSIGLRASDRAGQLELSWDSDARSIRSATRGNVEITDGERRFSYALDGAQLRRGSLVYGRKSGHVDVRMSVAADSGEPVEETVSFLGDPVPAATPAVREGARPAAAQLAAVARQRDELRRERDRALADNAQLRSSVQKLTKRNLDLAEAVRVLQHRVDVEVTRRRR